MYTEKYRSLGGRYCWHLLGLGSSHVITLLVPSPRLPCNVLMICLRMRRVHVCTFCLRLSLFPALCACASPCLGFVVLGVLQHVNSGMEATTTTVGDAKQGPHRQQVQRLLIHVVEHDPLLVVSRSFGVCGGCCLVNLDFTSISDHARRSMAPALWLANCVGRGAVWRSPLGPAGSIWAE